MSDWSKPIRPPRLPGCVPAAKPMPVDFAPVLRLAAVATAERYGISREHAGKWFKEWLKLPPSRRGSILMGEDDP